MAERKFDTSRFKGTSMKALNEQDNKVSKAIGDPNAKVRAGYHELEEGNNYFRIYPHHNAVLEMAGESDPTDKGSTFAENRVIYYLPIMGEDKDQNGNVKKDAKGRAILKEFQRAIFDSRVHGGTEKDIIDEYIKFVQKYAEENIKDEDARAAFLQPITGDWGKKIPGLKAKPSWIVFADKITVKGKDGNGETMYDMKFGKLEFGKAVRYGLNKLSAQEEANQPLGTDPFTDPVEGVAVNILYNKNADKPQDIYGVGFYSPKLGGGRIKLFPLEAEQLNNLLQFDSLYKQYKNVYRRRDFELAVEGLQNFDTKYSYNLINEPDFVAVMEEISSYYPKDTEEADKPAASEIEEAGEPEMNTGGTEQDQFDLMNREELKAWHKTNKTGLLVSKAHTDDALRAAAREFMAGVESEEDTTEQGKSEETKETPKAEGKSAAEIAKEKLKAMRAAK